MVDLYKDVKRIVDTNDIDVSGGNVLDEDMDTLRQLFETSLMKYDRSMKALDRAKNEIMRFKGQTADTLVEMGVFEMANTIRQDVQVPDTYSQTKELLANLLQIIEFIKLEKERVEKGIEDMVAIKENFENQCVQRCMDVKTELEKLPKLSFFIPKPPVPAVPNAVHRASNNDICPNIRKMTSRTVIPK